MEGCFGWESYWSLCNTDCSTAALDLDYFVAADTLYRDTFVVAFGANRFDIDETAAAVGDVAELGLDYLAVDTFDIDALDAFVAAAFETDSFDAAFGIEAAAAAFAGNAAAAEFAAFAAAFAAVAALPDQCLLWVFGCPIGQSPLLPAL